MAHAAWRKHFRDPPGISSQGTALLRTADIIRSVFLRHDMTSARYTYVISTTCLTLVSCLKPALEQPAEATHHCALYPSQSGDPASSPGFWSLACSTGGRQGAKGSRLSSCGLWGPSIILDLRADPISYHVLLEHRHRISVKS